MFRTSTNQSYLPRPTHSGLIPTEALHYDINQSKYVITSSNQTYLAITNHFGGYRRVFGKLLSDFWSTSPKIDDFWPQISPFLPTGASHNDTDQSKYVLTSSNQTYLAITNHFDRYWRVFVKLLGDFWSTSPQIDDFDP